MKYAVITGASTGIGRETAITFSKNGFIVFLLARTKDKLEETANIIKSFNGSCEVYPVDLTSVEEIEKFIVYIKERNISIDNLINVAGVWHDESKVFADTHFEEFKIETIINTYNVGVTAPTLLAHGLVPLMNTGSNIINISGTFENGAKGWLPYYVSKKAIESLTIGLAEELLDKKVNVNCISPSDTSTVAYKKYFPQFIPDSITPEEVATEIYKISTENITGQIRVVKK